MEPCDLRTETELPIRYRLVVDGELAPEWSEWFGTERVTTSDGQTVLELAVPDQAALFGLLRRVHDLHLRLISLTRMEK